MTIGAINWDISLFVSKFPRAGEEVVVKRVVRVPGGKAANVAVAAARVLGKDQVALIGALGRGSIGEEQVEALLKEGVAVSGIKFLDHVESGQAYIIVDEKGDNIIHTFFGANAEVMPQDLERPHTLQLIREAEVVVVMDPPLQAAEALAELGRSYGKIVMWSPGVRATLGMKALRSIISSAHYVLVNEAEAEGLTGSTELDEAWRRLAELNGKTKLVVTLGAEGCELVSRMGRLREPGIDLEKMGMRVVNTVGCGDAFIGTFAAYKAEGLADQEALRRANLAGALKATRVETRGSPFRKELEEFLKRVS